MPSFPLAPGAGAGALRQLLRVPETSRKGEHPALPRPSSLFRNGQFHKQKLKRSGGKLLQRLHAAFVTFSDIEAA